MYAMGREKGNMRKKIIAIILAAALVSALAGCAAGNKPSEEKSEKIVFVLDWTPNTNHTGLYVAQEKGYFEKAGLEVEIVQPPEDGAEMLVASEKAQFGVSFQDSMMSAIVGEDALPIEAVAAILQHNTSGILSRKGEGLERPKGMEGKKYATWDMDLEKATIRSVIKEDGGDYDKIEMIPSTVTDEVSALSSKSIDAVWVFYGWGGIAAETADLKTDYFAFKDINPALDFYTPVIIGNSEWMKKNKETTTAFLAAMKKGYEDAIADPAEAADILCKASPELDEELVSASQEYMKDQYQAEAEQWGYIEPERWNAFYNWVNENDLSETKIPENTGFSNDYLEN